MSDFIFPVSSFYGGKNFAESGRHFVDSDNNIMLIIIILQLFNSL